MVLEKTSIARKASIQTDSRRKVENFIEPLGARIVSLKKGDQFQVEADRHALKNLDLIYFSSQSPLLLENAQSDFVRIQFHHKGHGTTSIGQKVYNITQRQAVISPANVKVNFNKNFGYKSIRFGQAYLTQKMTALIQSPLNRPLEFLPTFDPTAPQSLAFKRVVDAFMKDFVLSETELPSLAIDEMESLLSVLFLTCCPSNYKEIIERPNQDVAPKQIYQVENYLEANWDKPVRLENLATIAGCSIRSLFRSFQKNRGYSPMTFLKQVRLKHAQNLLLTSQDMTVSKSARICGYVNGGRFSRDYAKAFGELPSATLIRNKNQLYI